MSEPLVEIITKPAYLPPNFKYLLAFGSQDGGQVVIHGQSADAMALFLKFANEEGIDRAIAMMTKGVEKDGEPL